METFSRPAGLADGLARYALGRHQAPIRPGTTCLGPPLPHSLQGIRPALKVPPARYPRPVAEAEETRAHRIAALADAALEQVEATRRVVRDLLAEVGGARPAPVVPLETSLDSARLVAIEMAVAGRSREDVGRHVRAAHDLSDVEALLDDVFGPPDAPQRFRASRFPQR